MSESSWRKSAVRFCLITQRCREQDGLALLCNRRETESTAKCDANFTIDALASSPDRDQQRRLAVRDDVLHPQPRARQHVDEMPAPAGEDHVTVAREQRDGDVL